MLRFNGGKITLGSSAATKLRVSGPAGNLLAKGKLQSPRFDAFGGTLELNIVSEVMGARGTVGTVKFPNHPNSRAQLVGDETHGLAIGRVSMDSGKEPAEDVGELTNVSLFSLDLAEVRSLARLRRLEPWWPGERWFPESRRRALHCAHAMTMSATDEEQKRAQRAQFWGKVSNMLHDKGASGHSQAVARELALDTRRVAAPRWSAEWSWLSFSKLFGYGTKFVQPLLLWVAVASLATLVLLAFPQADDAVSRPPFAVWFHLLVFAVPAP